MTREYVPDAGDLIWLDFASQAGREQAGRRPGVILSPAKYNQKAGLAILCPIASQVKQYPFEVGLPANSKILGVILADQVKSVDWRLRRAEKAGVLAATVLEQVVARIGALLKLH